MAVIHGIGTVLRSHGIQARREDANMWAYEKRLQYPVDIKTRDPKIAQIIISQYGGLLCYNL